MHLTLGDYIVHCATIEIRPQIFNSSEHITQAHYELLKQGGRLRYDVKHIF